MCFPAHYASYLEQTSEQNAKTQPATQIKSNQIDNIASIYSNSELDTNMIKLPWTKNCIFKDQKSCNVTKNEY